MTGRPMTPRDVRALADSIRSRLSEPGAADRMTPFQWARWQAALVILETVLGDREATADVVALLTPSVR